MKLKTKHAFPKPKFCKRLKRILPNEQHQEFLDDFEHLLRAPTVEDYNKRRDAFTEPGKWPLSAVEYVEGWLKWDVKLVSLKIIQFYGVAASEFKRIHWSLCDGDYRFAISMKKCPNPGLRSHNLAFLPQLSNLGHVRDFFSVKN